MKKNLCYILLFCVLISFGLLSECKKDNIANQLKGTWELASDVNGVSGQTTTYAKGNGSLMAFDTQNYQVVRNNQIIKQGAYKVIKDQSTITKEEGNRIIYDDDMFLRTFFQVNNDLLTFLPDIEGEGSVTFRRVNNNFPAKVN